jgi:hypothetical protein
MVGLSVRAPVGNCEIVLINLLSKGGDLDSKILLSEGRIREVSKSRLADSGWMTGNPEVIPR